MIDEWIARPTDGQREERKDWQRDRQLYSKDDLLTVHVWLTDMTGLLANGCTNR